MLFEGAGLGGVLASSAELKRRFFAKVRALRATSREQKYDQALEGKVIVLNLRLGLHAGSTELAIAEQEEALALDAAFGNEPPSLAWSLPASSNGACRVRRSS